MVASTVWKTFGLYILQKLDKEFSFNQFGQTETSHKIWLW